MDLAICCPRKAVKFDHSLTPIIINEWYSIYFPFIDNIVPSDQVHSPLSLIVTKSLTFTTIWVQPEWSINIETVPRYSAGWCFNNASQFLQNILSKHMYCRNRTSYENFKLKLCTCAQSLALGTHTKFQPEILTINVISGIIYFHEIILESSPSVSETTPWTVPKFTIRTDSAFLVRD